MKRNEAAREVEHYFGLFGEAAIMAATMERFAPNGSPVHTARALV